MSDPHEVVRFQAPEMPDMQEVLRYFTASQEARWYTNFGPAVTRLERRMSDELLGGRPVVTASNATVALMVALRAALGEPTPERRLIALPSFTFIASVSAVEWAGFEPLFCDVDSDDWQVSAASLDAALTEHSGRVAGVMLTTTFGTTPSGAKAAALTDVLTRHGLPVVTDAAAALGSVPSAGLVEQSVEVFSLHATKPFAVGEGAVVVCTDTEMADEVRRLTNFGFGPDHSLDRSIGFNTKMPELFAAVGLAVLDSYPKVRDRRRELGIALVGELSELGLTPQLGFEDSGFQFVPMRATSNEHRRRIMARAEAGGVQLRTYFDPPMHRVAALADCARTGDLSVTESLSETMVCFPMANDLDAASIARIVEVARDSE